MKKISIYQVEDPPIGCGGMGQVYLATDPRGNRVAIKEMLSQYVTDPYLRAHFDEEVKTLNNLEHHCIVKMFASFEEHGNLYLVMEYIEGETIDEHVRRNGPMSESKTGQVLQDLLSALQCVHQEGIVHRDLKPSNIMIRPNGRACLLDFGIAKNTRRDSGLTTMNQVKGTLCYMSPEQAEGFSIDSRSDVYSLGCVLFYMLTGCHAVTERESEVATKLAIINEPIPKVKSYNPEISDSIQRIVDKATQKNMLQRFQSCREFEMELNSGKTKMGSEIGESDQIISVGRKDCDIIAGTGNDRVSRYHLDIIKKTTPEGEIYLFRDRSTNGTVIDGERIKRREKSIVMEHRSGSVPFIQLAGEVDLRWNEVVIAFNKKYGATEKRTIHLSTPVSERQRYSPPPFEGKSATEWLVAIYVFAALGGLLGLAFGIFVYVQKTNLPNGQKVHKYKESHRTAALIGAIISVISFLFWIIVNQ